MGLNWLLNLIHKKKPSLHPVRPPAPTPTSPPPISPAASVNQELLDAHNRDRSARGLRPFTWNSLLVNSSFNHDNYMASHNSMTHQGPGELNPWQRMEQAGYHYSRAAENIARGQASVAAVMAAWENSPGHLANILGACTEMGGAMIYSSGGTPYWCVDFGTPAGFGVILDPESMNEETFKGHGISGMRLSPCEDTQEGDPA